MKKNSTRLLLSTLALSLALSSVNAAYAAAIPTAVEGETLPSLAPMLEKILPAVVTVYVEGTQTQRQRFPDDFNFFFGPNIPSEQPNTRPFEGLGSGVIINKEKGYVVTNNHVIDNATKIRIKLNDGKEYEAKLIGRDQQSDFALLQVSGAKDLTAITFADSDTLKVGDFAVAVGNPFGLGQTATSGIISAIGRSGLNVQGLENYIQTDASINRGNSGGALVNLKGELVGINTAILAANGGNIGIGFAIPSNMVQSLSEQLINFGELRRGQLGIKGLEMSSEVAKALNIDTQQGAFVSEVIPKSASEKAGLKAGDVIISLDNKPIHSFAELRARVATAGAGKKVLIGVLRGGKKIDLTVTLQQSDDKETNAELIVPNLQGATLSNGEYNKSPGIMVNEVQQNSIAYRVGLRKGDFILAVNRERVKNISELRKLMETKPSLIAINIIREGENVFLIIR